MLAFQEDMSPPTCIMLSSKALGKNYSAAVAAFFDALPPARIHSFNATIISNSSIGCNITTPGEVGLVNPTRTTTGH